MAEQKERFVVAAGIATHGERGIIDQGKEVTPNDLEGGKVAFDELVKRGVLVPAPLPEQEAAKPEEPQAPSIQEPAPLPEQEAASARQSRSRAVR